MSRAVILFAHGARDPAWAAPFERLRQLILDILPDATVSLAYLELMQPALPEQVALHAAAGVTEICIIPVFLGQGGHVRRDLPLLITQLQQAHPTLQFKVATAVGEDDAVLQAIARYCIVSAGI
ncbi:sirohydrochlorin chelatase [Herbaspirillum autotrophicum]|uniref:sirohydrochlorin chelatase n=1 Tax=Herbaspirillum autotrophicum TaxID=180195 RepID=UPI00067DE753|nr:CbiX/SirB N-terminal domain-containing protein [Herbaspirillum autotrophicum]